MRTTDPTRLAERSFLGITLVLAVACVTLQYRYGETYPPRGLSHGDSYFYAWMALDFPNSVLAHKLDEYRVKRSLPAAIVYSAQRLVGRTGKDHFDVVQPFRIFDSVLLVAIVLLWNGIAKEASLSIAGRWLGFLLLVGNFAYLKHLLYNGVMTDTAAAAIGALLVYAYLRSKAWLLAFALFAGAFTWPAILVPASPLLLFPRRSLEPSTHYGSRAAWLVGAGSGLAYAALLALGLRYPHEFLFQHERLATLHTHLLPISIPIALASVAFAFAFSSDIPPCFAPRPTSAASREPGSRSTLPSGSRRRASWPGTRAAIPRRTRTPHPGFCATSS